MEDFLYHKLSEEEKDRVKREAKKMLDSFSDKISKINVPEEEPSIRRNDFEREEKNGEECDLSFKKIMFENAPNKSNDFIIAETKRWE
jgi:Asp-tRNA(Asn)/Glu-tRNA(Gln) amidotransferase C subunit